MYLSFLCFLVDYIPKVKDRENHKSATNQQMCPKVKLAVMA